MLRKKIKATESEHSEFILSDEAIYFIKNYAMKELNVILPIDEDKFYEILEFADECELHMIDEDGNDRQDNYPEKERDIFGDKFVTEVSGKNCEPDLDDLNRRLL